MLKKEKTLKCDNCVKNRERERRKSIKLRNHDLLFVDLNKNCFSIMRKILVERDGKGGKGKSILILYIRLIHSLTF